MSAANQLPYLMTVAEFLDWPTPDRSDRWELIDGTPEAMAPSHPRHGCDCGRNRQAAVPTDIVESLHALAMSPTNASNREDGP